MIPDQTSWKRVSTYMYTDIFYIYIRIFACIPKVYTCIYTLDMLYVGVYTHTHTRAHTHTYTPTHLHIHTYIYISNNCVQCTICICVCVCVCVCRYAHISLYYNTLRNEGALSTYYLVIYNNLLYLKTFLRIRV